MDERRGRRDQHRRGDPRCRLAALVTIAAASAGGPWLSARIAGVIAYAGAVALAGGVAVANVKKKESALKALRTSTSCALDGASDGERAHVAAAAEALMPGSGWREPRRRR